MSNVLPSSTPDKSFNTKRGWSMKAIVGICAALLLACGVGIVVLVLKLTSPVIHDDPLSMKFVRLPKGTFYMGGGGGKAGQKTEIKQDFEIAIHTVTQEQWLSAGADGRQPQ